jgi:hypothetical protein
LIRKKKQNVKQVMKKLKKKINLKILKMNPRGSNVISQSCLDPITK